MASIGTGVKIVYVGLRTKHLNVRSRLNEAPSTKLDTQILYAFLKELNLRIHWLKEKYGWKTKTLKYISTTTYAKV